MEQYRLTQLDKKETSKEKVLSDEELEEALQFLENQDLLNKTNEIIGRSLNFRAATIMRKSVVLDTKKISNLVGTKLRIKFSCPRK